MAEDKDAVLSAWCTELAEALGLGGLEVDIDRVLGLAGVAAHSVVRPAAPLTTYLVGYAAGLAAAGDRAKLAPLTEQEATETALRLAKAHGSAGSGE